MPNKVLIILADGFEDVEAVTSVDILRRAGLGVTVAGLESKRVKGARGIVVEADVLLDDVAEKSYDACVLPGGTQGAERLAASEGVRSLVKKMDRERKWIAAICAAPAVVLAPLGILNNRRATCFPGLEEKFDATTQFVTDSVAVDGHILTSRALGTAVEFSLAIVEKLCGGETAGKIQRLTLAAVHKK